MSRTSLGILTATAALAASGCTPNVTPMELNTKIAEANIRLARSAQSFRKTVLPLSSGQTVSAQAARGALDQVRQELANVQKDMRGVIPPSSSGCRNYYDAYVGFLQGQEQILNKEFAGIVRTVEQPNQTPQTKWPAVRDAFARAEQTERGDLDKLRSFQAEFAKANKFQAQGSFGGF